MKYISLFLLLFILTINLNKSFAEDALTIKQQLDRIMEEVKDLNKAVFNKSFDNEKLNSLDEKIGRAHVRTPVTEKSRMPSSA